MRYRCTYATGPTLTSFCRGEEGVVAEKVTPLRQDLLAALGEPLPVEGLEGELSWRRGWNSCRVTMLAVINRLLPEEE